MSSATWIAPHRGWSGYGPDCMPNLFAAETNTKFPYGTIPQGDQPTTWCPDCVSFTMKYCSYWNSHLFWTQNSPAHNASAQTTIHAFNEYLSHSRDIPQKVASEQGTHFTAKEVCQWVHNHRIHLTYYVSYHPEAANFIEWWNELLKAQIIVPAKWQYLMGLGQVLKVCVFWVSIQEMVLLLQ